MIYDLRHRTTYSYMAEVTFARCVLRLTPRTSASQTLLENLVTVTPPPSDTHRRIGPFGEEALTVVIDTPHTELVIEATSKVDVHAPPLRPPGESPPWEMVRAASFESSGLGTDDPALYLYPTQRTPLAPAIGRAGPKLVRA